MRLRPVPPLAAAVLACTLVTACSGSAARGGSPDPSPVPARSGAASASTPPASGPAVSATPDPRQPITIALAGDVHFAAQVGDLLKQPDSSLSSLRPRLAGADLAMVNLETAITTRGSEQPKQFHFRAPPSALRALAAAGVDVVTMANNHAVDYGRIGLTDTLAARRRSPIPIVGIGADAQEAYAPAYLSVRGHTIAVLGATQIPDWTLATWPAGEHSPGVAVAARSARLVAAVRAARKKADLVLVYLHWGTDYTTCPNALQERTARALADAGAGLIVGSHAHRLQGGGWLGTSYVDYGLGNFVWWRRNSVADATTGVLTVAFDPAAGKVTRARWAPMMVTGSGLPADAAGPEAARLAADWTAARTCTRLASRAPS